VLFIHASRRLISSDKQPGRDPADKDLAASAAIFKYDFKVPFVDAFAGSLALHEKATLVTADYDFKSVPSGTIKIEFLPAK
jgi:predicted nucleic acid-binding protein